MRQKFPGIVVPTFQPQGQTRPLDQQRDHCETVARASRWVVKG